MTDVRSEYGPVLGIGQSLPRLSWVTRTASLDWLQASYEIEVDGHAFGRKDSGQSVLVPWPGEALASRSTRRVRVRVWGADGSESQWSEPLDIEAGLLEASDWTAEWISAVAADDDGRPLYLRTNFAVSENLSIDRARLYATSAGIHQIYLNGQIVSDTVLDPGWSSYGQRIRYETYDVKNLIVRGANVAGAVIADGWWRGHLTWDMRRNVYGDRLGLLFQLEITYSDGTTSVVTSGPEWSTSPGPLIAADLYNGETYDARLVIDGWSAPSFDDSTWRLAEVFHPTVGRLVARLGPPVRRTGDMAVREVIRTPSGRAVLDFGQNIVGWVRFTVLGEAGTVVTIRHAEVLDQEELGTRPLRNAQATDRYTLRGGGPETWEPAFTFHGFRYVEVDGWPGELDVDAFAAVVIHTDLERTGTFSCSNDLLNRLHENVVWSTRGNFVDIPTDCPQRDERLGWTGDLQVFAPTASYIFGVNGFMADWLEDLRADQQVDGAMPVVIPDCLGSASGGLVAAAWGDAATIVPWTLYQRYGDKEILARQFDSMRSWVDFVRGKAGDRLLWPEEFQLGDWLDPDAPPDEPFKSKTDPILVSSAYFARSAQIVSDAASVLGRAEVADEYGKLAEAVRTAFRAEYMTPNGLMASDSVTAYALAIVFNLYEDERSRARGAHRLQRLIEAASHHITTGFVGTPIVLPALSAVGATATAYRLLTETSCPSWLYPVTMGATTIWERWDSLLPDGSINQGEMTSFNHYALGSVADWMHQKIGGISPEAPGYRVLRFAPLPGRGVNSASASLITPYGRAACEWSLDADTMTFRVDVPANTSAVVERPGHEGNPLRVGSGSHRWVYSVPTDLVAAWTDNPSADD